MESKFIHTIFRLTFLISILFSSNQSNAQTTLISTSSNWKYSDSGSNLGTSWKSTTFADAEWKSGNSELGYGDSPTTAILSGKIGYYFRKTISISSVTAFSNFTMKIRRDDGIVVYVNNVEVYRNNMPTGTILYNTPASSTCSDDGSTIFNVILPISLFSIGNNVIATEVHNRSTASGDITFELQLIGNPAPISTCGIPDANLFGTRNITSSSIETFWTAVTGATSYNIAYRVRNSGLAYSSAFNTSSTYYVLTGLLPSTNYEFIAQAVCSGGATSAFSSSGWFTTLSGPSSTTTLVRGPYLTLATSSATTIQWRTSTATSNEVKYGISTTMLNNSASNSTISTEHVITISGLIANTKYYYSIGQIGSVLQGNANNFFYTAPTNGSSQAVKFWVTGDFGMGSANQISVRNSFAANTSGQVVNGWLWLGDNAYTTGTDAEYQSKVFAVYPDQFKNIPVFPAPGNHDYASSGYQSSAALGTNFPYFNIFTLPQSSGTEKYYSTNYGNVHFISLDSYGSYNNSSSAMYNWLRDDLAANILQWTVVYFHHPPYSKGSHDSDVSSELVSMRQNIIPLLELNGVDLVMSGHSHSYERSYFIKNHTGVENTFISSLYPTGNEIQSGGGPYSKSTRKGNGTVYVVCGTGGQAGNSTSSGYPHNAMFKSILSVSGSLVLDVNGNTLSCKFLSASGSIDDQFTISKPSTARFSDEDDSENISVDKNEMNIYPNPTSGDIHISFDDKTDMELKVSILSSTGKILFRKMYSKVDEENILIEKNEMNLMPGIYFVNVAGDRFNNSRKLVIN